MKNKIELFFIVLTCFIISSHAALSCNVPVFRYALELWPADLYEVVVFYQGALTSEDRSNIDWLEKSSAINIPYYNYTVQAVDISSGISDTFRKIWERSFTRSSALRFNCICNC